MAASHLVLNGETQRASMLLFKPVLLLQHRIKMPAAKALYYSLFSGRVFKKSCT